MAAAVLALLLAAGCDVPRDAHGRIARSRSAVEAFKRAHPAPAYCLTDGKVDRRKCQIDHARPLCLCGEDVPENLQWMRYPEAAMKDALEVAVCREAAGAR